MSLVRKAGQEQLRKHNRYYLRYYRTIIEARNLNQQVYGDSKTKGNTQLKFEHPLRVAHLTEDIKNQKIGEYHMNWLVGLLHDTKEDGFLTYCERIDDVLKDLLPEQKKQVLLYIDQLTSDDSLSKGQKKRDQIEKMGKLDLIPCWIRIFDKYDNCRRFRQNPVGKSPEEINGYCSVAYLCYDIACRRFEEIRNNIQKPVKQQYQDICKELGGLQKVKKIADEYLKENQ